MKATAEVVRAALDETERAQSVAMDAIQLAQNNTKGTMDLVNSVSLTSVTIQRWLLASTTLIFLLLLYLFFSKYTNMEQYTLHFLAFSYFYFYISKLRTNVMSPSVMEKF